MRTVSRSQWQRRYEALRASFVERLPARVVADRFGYSTAYIHLMRHQFRHGKIDFSETVPDGKAKRRKVTKEVRRKIRAWRERRLSAGEIAQMLSEDGVDISVRSVERVLAEEGFPKLPRRTGLKAGVTVKGTEVPERSRAIGIEEVEGLTFDSLSAGIFLFAPFLARLGIDQIVRAAGLPGTKAIPARSYLLSFLSMKLLGTERYAHMGDHGFDRALGLFAGLNVLPKCTAMSTYSYSLDEIHLQRLQKAFVKSAWKLGLYDASLVNLDIPVELLVGNYARRWRVENGIAEAVKFFNLNSLSSPILTKIHFDVAMTMIADTLYTMLARKLRGFEDCDAPKLYRHFVRGKGTVSVKDNTVIVTYPRRAHNPILRQVPWTRLPQVVPGIDSAPLALRFR